MGNSKRSILAAIAYSDVFDFPLTKQEIWGFLTHRKLSKDMFEQELQSLFGVILFRRGLYCFFDRKKIIEKRKKREKESSLKLRIAKHVSSCLSFIPTIQFIAISGSLAMKNADKEDDIDLFVIVKKNSLWITRFLTLLFLEVLRRRRKRGQISVTNLICVNMIIDETSFAMPKKHQNLYGAHEIVQMRPLFERDSSYEHFLSENAWVQRFLPHASSQQFKKLRWEKAQSSQVVVWSSRGLRTFESFAKQLQVWYMRGHTTRETISNHMLFFHPQDYTNTVLYEYKRRLRRYERFTKRTSEILTVSKDSLPSVLLQFRSVFPIMYGNT